MSTPEDVKSSVAALFDRTARTYDSVNVDFFRPMGRELVERAAVQAGEHVLDVGCGRGAALFAAVDAVGETGSVIGVDLAPTMVDLTRTEIRTRGLTNAIVRLDDAEAPNFPPSSFDVVLANLVIFFLPDPAAALRNYATLLLPGGRVAFSSFGTEDDRYRGAMAAIAQFAPGYSRLGANSPFRAEDTIRELLADVGYERLTITEAEFQSRFRDADHWLEWAWSHGGRSLLERVPADRLAEARAAAFEVIEQARDETGDLVLTTKMRFTVAEPGTPATP